MNNGKKQINDWILRYRGPETGTHKGEKILLMFHGWTGDENAMWVFTKGLPETIQIIAPRGPVLAGQTGYGWANRDDPCENYLEIARTLIGEIKVWFDSLNIETQPFSILGFSQGAAVALSLALLFPDQIRSLICVAGYFPAGITNIKCNLEGLPVYIAHGTQDSVIPVSQARSVVKFLSENGANVTYCENDVGHKLSLDCFKGFEQFIIQNP